MRSKQWRGALLGLVVTSLLLGALASPSMAGAEPGLLGAGMAMRRVTAAAIRAADRADWPRPYCVPGAGYSFGGSYSGGRRAYGRPWGHSYSNGYLPGCGAFFGSSYYGSGYGYSSYGGFCR